MPRPSPPSKQESFNFRVDASLKAAFTAATALEDRPAAQVLRSFMRAYVARRERRAFAAEAHRQSVAAAAAAADPTSNEENGLRKSSQVMIDKSATVPRAKLGPRIGRLEADTLRSVERALQAFLGLRPGGESNL